MPPYNSLRINIVLYAVNLWRHVCPTMKPFYHKIIRIGGFFYLRPIVFFSYHTNIILLYFVLARNIKSPAFAGLQSIYSAKVPTDIVILRIPLLMDFSLFIFAFIISPV